MSNKKNNNNKDTLILFSLVLCTALCLGLCTVSIVKATNSWGFEQEDAVVDICLSGTMTICSAMVLAMKIYHMKSKNK